MSAKIDYLKQELNTLKAQLAADDKAELRKQIAVAEDKIKARETLGLEPDRAEAEAVATLVHSEVGRANAKQVSVPEVADFMAGFDAAVDPE